MPYVPPWLKGVNVTQAMSAGASAGAQMASIRQRAAEAMQRGQIQMAAIAQREAASARSAAVARERIAAADRAGRRGKQALEAKLRQEGRELSESTRRSKAAEALKGRELDIRGTPGQTQYRSGDEGIWELNPGKEPRFIPQPGGTGVMDGTTFNFGGEAPGAAQPAETYPDGAVSVDPAADLRGESPGGIRRFFGNLFSGGGQNQVSAMGSPLQMATYPGVRLPSGQAGRKTTEEEDPNDPLGLLDTVPNPRQRDRQVMRR